MGCWPLDVRARAEYIFLAVMGVLPFIAEGHLYALDAVEDLFAVEEGETWGKGKEMLVRRVGV